MYTYKMFAICNNLSPKLSHTISLYCLPDVMMAVSSLMASALSVSLQVLRAMISSRVRIPPTSKNSVRKLNQTKKRNKEEEEEKEEQEEKEEKEEQEEKEEEEEKEEDREGR